MRIVSRNLADKEMQRISHALGHPIDPFNKETRNYFASSRGSSTSDKMAASAFWEEHPGYEDMQIFLVTDEGRLALDQALADEPDPQREYEVTIKASKLDLDGKDGKFYSYGRNHSNARYRYWLELTDAIEGITFKEFCQASSIRLSERQKLITARRKAYKEPDAPALGMMR